MSDDDILAILQADLGEMYPDPARRLFLENAVTSARAFIAREGITLTESAEDGKLVEMYAAYLVRKRAEGGPMPRMLRWALNNRLISEKAGGPI